MSGSGSKVRSRGYRRPDPGASLLGRCASLSAFDSQCRKALSLFIAIAASFGLSATLLQAQDNTRGLVRPGDAIVTGFSGVLDRSGAAARSPGPATLFIDPDGASARGFDVSKRSGGGGAAGQMLAPEFLTVTARQVGQVFGIALDDATDPSTGLPAPNIYVAATSAYGLALVRPGQGGKPQRLFAGAADARWMDGQFGEGGGPGSIWKIDGLTGEVSLFANVTHNGQPNSAPGLGNIAYDPQTQQLYVSDRATGLVHRFSLDGTELGTFDHGVTARTAAGLGPVRLQDNGARIASRDFRTADPSTWGFADPRRRVWGLAVRQQRLYYAVAEGAEVWSVRLNDDGSFDTESARFEIKLPDHAQLLEIADIAFTRDGEMILAQRPPTTGAPDFGVLVKVRPSRLLRYSAETPDDQRTKARWQPIPAEYTVGMTTPFRSAMGGVAPGFGYDASGNLDLNSCAATVWATGDDLRESPFATSGAGGPEQGMAAGIQGLSVDSLRQDGTPPADAFVVDFDGQFPATKESGHVGDVAIAGPCQPDVAIAPAVTAPGMPGAAAPGVPATGQPQQPDLSITKQLVGPCAQGQDCRFEIVVTNLGSGDYQGPLVLSDTLSIAGITLVGAAPAPWTCGQAVDRIGCNHPTLLLRPGHSTILPLTLNYAANATGWRNCAAITWLGSGTADAQSLRAVQIELAGLGYYGGPINGVADNDTQNAIRALQKDLGLPQTGEVSPELLEWMFGAGANMAADGNAGNDRNCVDIPPQQPAAGQPAGAGEVAGPAEAPAAPPGQPTGGGEVIGPTAAPTVPPGQPTGGGEVIGPTAAPPGGGAVIGPTAGPAFDLTIEKASPHGAPGAAAGAGMVYACEAQKPCPFAVTITNVGIEKYEGPLSFLDTSKGGWSYGGASAGWSCAPAASGFTCTGNVSLAPGASTSVNITLDPMPGVPLDPVQGENCAQLVWQGGKGDINAGNDGPSCMPVSLAASVPSIPGAEVGVEVEGPDLSVRKEAVTPACAPGEECWFNIFISGTQGFPFTGRFKVTDTCCVPVPKAAGTPASGWPFAGGGNLGLWSCDKDKGSVCTYDVSKYPGLPPGGFTSKDTLGTDIRFTVPADAKLGPYANCVTVTFDQSPGGGIKEAKTVCAPVQVAYRPKLTIAKNFDKNDCASGKACDFSVTIKNEGKGAYTGFLSIWDSSTPENLIVDSVSGENWNCTTKFSTLVGLFICRKSKLEAGEAATIKVKARLPSTVTESQFENCAQVELHGPRPGDLDSADKAHLVRDFLEHNGYQVSGGDVLTAAEKNALADYKTKNPKFKDAKGNIDVSDEITDDFLKSLLPDVADASGKDVLRACDKVNVARPGLIISKKFVRPAEEFPNKSAQATWCAVDHSACQFVITVQGASDAPYTDPIVIEDSTSPGGWWQLEGYWPTAAVGGGWSCTGTTKFRCTHPPANLTRNSKPLELTLAMKPTTAYYQAAYDPGNPHTWIHNCARIQYQSAAQYQLQKREEYESCYKLRLVGSDRALFGYDATGTGSCLPPKCSYYEFTATLGTRPPGPPVLGAAPAPGYDPTGTGNCLPPNCGAGATTAGGGGYQGPLSMTIKPPPGSSFQQARVTKSPASCPASGWSCTRSGAEFGGVLTCRISNCTLAPGDQVTVRVDGNVAADLKEPLPVEQTREVCGELAFQPTSPPGSIEQKVGLETKKACVTTRILARPPPKGDLQISSVPQGRCRIGTSCAVTNTITNAGGNRFVTPPDTQIQGQVDPPVSIRGLRAEAAGWLCRSTGGGRYACARTSLPFDEAASEQINFELAIPRNFTGDKITHSVRIVWPVAADSNPANDTAAFTIPVRAPPSPPPPVVAPKPAPPPATPREVVTPPKPPEIKCIGGSVLRANQTCVCPNRKVPVRIGPNAYRCECPRGSVEVRGLCITCPSGTRWDGRRCTDITPKAAPKPPEISCRGGTVVRGICICPRGTIRKQRGARSFRCEPLKLETIPGGTLQQAPRPPRVSCRGGSVVRGICICPRGTIRRRRGANSYRCEPLRLQTVPGVIKCPPKTKLVNGRCVRVVQ